MDIYVVRHGETQENKKKNFYGRLDVNLNQEGKIQGQKISKILSAINFDSIYVSERVRAQETAKIAIKNYDNCDVIVDSRINELDFGIFEGNSHEEIKAKYPAEYKKWSEDWKNYCPPQGESYVQFYNRVKNFMDEIGSKKSEKILVVTHGGVQRSIYCYILGNMDYYWSFASKNGDISLIKNEYGNWYIDCILSIKQIDMLF